MEENNQNIIFGYIYCMENIVNHHKYIGQTTLNIDDRVKEHFRISPYRDTAIYNAIKKYKEENFIYYQLDVATSQEELDDKETHWINYYNTYLGEGYNMTNGGQLEKQNYKSQEVIDNYSKFRGGRSFMIFDVYGNHIKTMISQTQFAREIVRDIRNVHDCLIGKQIQIEGYILIYEDNYSDDLLQKRLKRYNKRYSPFAVFDNITSEYIGVWINKSQCARDLDYSQDTISRILRLNLSQYSGKYKLKYLSNCNEQELNIIKDKLNKNKLHNYKINIKENEYECL